MMLWGYNQTSKSFYYFCLHTKVLLAKSGRCFTEPEESFCGNLRVEGDEECDAGLLGSEDTDLCCDDFGDEPAYPVLWVSNMKGEAPWGEIVYMEGVDD